MGLIDHTRKPAYGGRYGRHIRACRLAVWLALLPAVAAAQADRDTLAFPPAVLPYTYLWLHTTNAAGLGVDSLPTTGSTYVEYITRQGDFRRPQMAEASRGVGFASERYQEVGPLTVYGSFRFDRQTDDQVLLADVLDPYRGTPYILADSLGGDWKKQVYTLQLKVASGWLAHGKLKAGVSAYYQNATGARQNDPRPLNYVTQLSVGPSLVYRVHRYHTVGVTGWLERFQEDVSLEIRQPDVSHRLYKLLGIGQYANPTPFSVGARRNYTGNRHGGDLQYVYRRGAWAWLTEVGYRTYQEEITEGGTFPYSGGTYQQKQYTFRTALQRDAAWTQRVTVHGASYRDTGIQNNVTFNPTTRRWETILRAPFYDADATAAGLDYETLRPAGRHHFSWRLTGGIRYTTFKKNYVYPASSQQLDYLQYSLGATRQWPLGAATLQAGVTTAYGHGVSASLHHTPSTINSDLVARAVLYPDHDYLQAARWQHTVDVSYIFTPLRAKTNRFFLQARGEWQHRADAPTAANGPDGARSLLTVTFGSLY